jgi:hypothetical protein
MSFLDPTQDGPWAKYKKASPTPMQPARTAPRPIYGPAADPAEAERDRIALERDRIALERDQRGTPPAGYRWSAQGSLEPIPGGPAEKPKTRPLPEAARVKLESNVGAYEAFRGSAEGFNDDYAGNLLGDAENWLQGFSSDIGTPNQRQWWARFYSADQQIRNDLYGAALTATEKAAYDRTTVNPRMDPKEIRANLAERAEILRKALTRQVGAYRANGFEPEAIDAAAGERAADFTPDYADRTNPVLDVENSTPEISTTVKTVENPWAKRYGNQVGTMIAEGVPDEEILDFARRTNQGSVGNLPDILQWRRSKEFRLWKQKYPNQPVPVETTMEVPLSAAERSDAELAASPIGAIAAGAGDVATAGFGDELVGLVAGEDAQNEIRRKRSLIQEKRPYSYGFGQALGGAIPLGRALGVGRISRPALSNVVEGAALGGIYGAGSADPPSSATTAQTLTARATGAVTGAALGGSFAYGLSALGKRVRRGGGGDDGPPAPRETMDAATRQDINLLPADVGGPLTRATTAIARQGWLSEAPITRAAEEAARRAGAARDRAAATVGRALDKDDAGEAVRRAANVYSKETSRTGEALYNRAFNLAKGTRVNATKAVARLDDHIQELKETPGGSALLDELTSLRSELAGGNFSIRGMRNLRTRLREEAEFKGLRGGDTTRRLKDVVEAASEDIVKSLLDEGNDRAANAFATADRFWRKRVETIDDVLEPVLGKNSPRSGEHILTTLERMANRETGDAARLRRLVRAMPAEEARSVRATVIQRLGQPKPGRQIEAEDTFSFNEFLTRWNGLSPKAKAILFPPEAKSALDDIARVARGAKATASYSNSSNTGRALMGQAIFSTLVGGAVDLTAAGQAAAGQFLLGRALASPTFARWLARTPKLDRQAAIDGLAVVARRDPAIAQDALGLQRYLQQALNSAPTRAAADEEQK